MALCFQFSISLIHILYLVFTVLLSFFLQFSDTGRDEGLRFDALVTRHVKRRVTVDDRE